MKKTLVYIGIMLAMTGSAFAGSDTVTIPLEDYKAILQRLDSLQKRVDTLETKKESSPQVASVTKDEKRSQDIDNIYDTLDVLETKQIQNKINFGAELRVRWDGYTAKNFNVINMDTLQQGMLSGLSPKMALFQSLEPVDKETNYKKWLALMPRIALQ